MVRRNWTGIHLEAVEMLWGTKKLTRGLLVPGEDVGLVSLILASSKQLSISYTF